MDRYLPAVQQMNDINNAIHALIVILIVGLGGVFTTLFAIFRWYLPRRFQQQTEEREARIKALQSETESKAKSEAVDIERERMLPRLIESNISMSQSINQTLMQSAQQTSIYIAQLTAHDKQLTSNTVRLEELAQTVDTAITNIQLLKSAVEANTDHSKSAAAFGSQAATAATETLEIVKREINKLVVTSKGDTGEIKPLTVDKPADAASEAA